MPETINIAFFRLLSRKIGWGDGKNRSATNGAEGDSIPTGIIRLLINDYIAVLQTAILENEFIIRRNK